MIQVFTVSGIGEISPGDDLAALFASYVEEGDVVVVTSKIVSKAEGRLLTIDREAAITQETDRDVAQRGETRIVRNRLGLTMAAAGVDASNTSRGTVVLLPEDPDASARAMRDALPVNAAVIVTDTAGRAWRNGQTDIAIGAAGIAVLHEYAGHVDAYGNPLAVTAPAIADELAGAGDLVKGKLSGCPIAIVRGLPDLVLPRGTHGPGARSLVRDEDHDMFGYGAREAVMHALQRDGNRGFGAPAPVEVLVDALRLLGAAPVVDGAAIVVANDIRLTAAAYAHSWEVSQETPQSLRFLPRFP